MFAVLPLEMPLYLAEVARQGLRLSGASCPLRVCFLLRCLCVDVREKPAKEGAREGDRALSSSLSPSPSLPTVAATPSRALLVGTTPSRGWGSSALPSGALLHYQLRRLRSLVTLPRLPGRMLTGGCVVDYNVAARVLCSPVVLRAPVVIDTEWSMYSGCT